jgi:hypothetical protein
MGNINPMFSTDFEVLPKGTYLFEVKEAGIENTNPKKEGDKVRRRYWLKFAVVGGELEGSTHLESFFSDTKDDFSFKRMFGCLLKLKVIPAEMQSIDTRIFGTDKFEDRFRRGTKGLRMGAKIGWRYKDDDKEKENPQSEMKTFYTEEEVVQLMGLRGSAEAGPAKETPAPTVPAAPTTDEWGRPLNSPAPAAASAPEAEKPKAPWA